MKGIFRFGRQAGSVFVRKNMSGAAAKAHIQLLQLAKLRICPWLGIAEEEAPHGDPVQGSSSGVLNLGRQCLEKFSRAYSQKY